jgi:aspartate racemase
MGALSGGMKTSSSRIIKLQRDNRSPKVHKRIGIIGGLSPESTATYYQYITRTYTERFGDYAYPEILIYSVSFQPYVDWPAQERWDLVADGLAKAGRNLEAAGADFLIIATNTMHFVLEQVEAAVQIPILSLLDVVGQSIQSAGLERVALLGTRFTMEKSFFKDALASQNISVLIPSEEQRMNINRAIYEELVAGIIREETRINFLAIIDDLINQGAQGVILGCTEIPLLINQQDVAVPLFDTTLIHAEAALQYGIKGNGMQ